MISIETILGILLAVSVFALVQVVELLQQGRATLGILVACGGLLGLSIVIVFIVEALNGSIPS